MPARVVIEHRGVRLADSCRTVRTLETSHPASYDIPVADIAPDILQRGAGGSPKR